MCFNDVTISNNFTGGGPGPPFFQGDIPYPLDPPPPKGHTFKGLPCTKERLGTALLITANIHSTSYSQYILQAETR